MNKRRSSEGVSRAAVIAAVVGLLAVAAVVITTVGLRRSRAPVPTNRSNVNASAADRTAGWATYYYRPFSINVRIPPGLQVCESGQTGVTIRTDSCDAKTTSLFSVRRSDRWLQQDAVAVFDEAFAQELREAGIPSVADRATTFTGEGTNVILLKLSDSLVGAVVREDAAGAAERRVVAVDVRRDGTLPVGTTLPVDDLTQLFLQQVSFAQKASTASKPSGSVPAGWKTDVNGVGSFTISYPEAATPYTADPPAAISVMLTGNARFELRYGGTADATRPSTAGYRKLNDKPITVNGKKYTEERFIPGNSTNGRLLFVSIEEGGRFIGVSYQFSGNPQEEGTFEQILGTLSFDV